MFKKILVPVDGSEPSDSAVALAVTIASDQNAELIFCHALEVVEYAAWEGATPLPVQPEESTATKMILERAKAAATQAGVSATTRVVSAEVVEGLLTLVRESGADLVVMASHGRSGVARAVIGSKTESFLRRSTVPVLVAPHP